MRKEYVHHRTGNIAFVSVESIAEKNIKQLERWIEIQLNKHGWYQK